MRVTLEKMFSSLSGQDSETTRVVIGLFQTSEAIKKATGILDRHRFVDQDLVQIIDQSRISASDATTGQPTHMAEILVKLGLSPQKAHLYADKVKQGYTLLVVRSGVERAREAANIMHRANAEDVA